MGKWGPQGKRGAVAFSFDNMGEAAELQTGQWPPGQPIGSHRSVHENLPFLLQTLKEFDLKATFFLEAWNADHYPHAVKAIVADGHEVGCHGYRHETWFALDAEQQDAVFKQAYQAFTSIGVQPRGFRPPGGLSSEGTEALAATLGYTYISPVGGGAGIRGGLAVIPSEVNGTDVCYYEERFGRFRHPGARSSDETEAFVEGFRLMLDDLVSSEDCRAPICHVTTDLASQARKDAFRRVVEACVTDDRLWKPTLGEAAAWIRSHADQFPVQRMRGFEPDWDPRTIVNEAGAAAFKNTDAGR